MRPNNRTTDIGVERHQHKHESQAKQAKSSLHMGKAHPPTIVSLINLKMLSHIVIQYEFGFFTSFCRSVNLDGLGNFHQPLDDTRIITYEYKEVTFQRL